MKPVLFANGLIISNGGSRVGTIVVADGLIRSVDRERVVLSDIDREQYDVVDCEGKMILPGVIDGHVHFRDPGMTEKGDIATESRAAVAGGVTSFFDMPNTKPATVTLEAWEDKNRRAAEVSVANYAFFIGATNSNLDQILAADPERIPGVKLFLGSSTGNMLVDDDSVIVKLFRQFKGVIACHAESESVIAANRETLKQQYPEGIPVGMHHILRSRRACVEASTHAVELARLTGARLHLLHITTADELSLLSSAPIDGKRITAETCPHYLIFNHESVVETDGLTKCNPAIKTETDRKALIMGVNDGTIDVIATDHAPHLLVQKRGNALTAASGMPSIGQSLTMMLQLAREGCFKYETVVEKMCENPARLFGVDRRGFLRPGYRADIAIVDPAVDYVIKPEDVISSCGWTPYAGKRVNFRVEQTWVNGQLVYDCRLPGKFTGLQTSMPLRFRPL